MIPESNYQSNDPRYLSSKDYDEPKEYFKILGELIKGRLGGKPASLLDVGCAAGAFIYYVNHHVPALRFVGTDISDQHLKQARQHMPDFEWVNASITDLSPLKNQRFDIVTCLGTLAIFDEVESLLKDMFERLNPGGALYIFDLVNDHPIDVLMRWRKTTSTGHSDWQSAFNVRSQIFYSNVARKLGSGVQFRAVDFRLPFSIAPTPDPLRAWTIKTADNPHQLVVGTNQLLNFKILEFSK